MSFDDEIRNETGRIASRLNLEEAWVDYSFIEIFQSVHEMAHKFPSFVNAEIATSKRKDDETRDKALGEMLLERGLIHPLSMDRDTDVLLAQKMLLWRANISGFTRIEGICFSRVRALADTVATKKELCVSGISELKKTKGHAP